MLDLQTKKELKELLGELGPDTLLLLFSNFTVVILAMVQGWNIIPLLWIYWSQSVIIGFFNWRRIKQLKTFSTKGFKIDGQLVEATEKTKKSTARFFLLHFGLFQISYFIFLMSITETIPTEVILSASVGITLFLFNHFYSYRYNLEKDLATIPNVGTMMFFPYARIIPMHLIIFIGLWVGRGSKTELFFFLLLKTGVDLLMHVVQHVNWKEEKDLKSKKVSSQASKQRMTVKARLKLWFLLGWAAFLILIVITFWVMAEFNRL